MSAMERTFSDEIQQLRNDLQLVGNGGETSIDDARYEGDDGRAHDEQRPVEVQQR